MKLSLFNERYGENAYDLLVRMLKDPLVSLTDTARYFGISKQRVSLFFDSIFGVGYAQCFPRVRVPFRYRPKNRGDRCISVTYSNGMEILRREGFVPVLVPHRNSNRILVNGYTIVVLALSRDGFGRSAHAALRKGRKDRTLADFYLFVLDGVGGYLVPYPKVPNGGITVSLKTDAVSKYNRYLNDYRDLWLIEEV